MTGRRAPAVPGTGAASPPGHLSSRHVHQGGAMAHAPISADSHIVEPPNCYIDYIEPRYRAIAPRCDVNAQGAAAYTIDGITNPIAVGMLAAAGMTPEQVKEHKK